IAAPVSAAAGGTAGAIFTALGADALSSVVAMSGVTSRVAAPEAAWSPPPETSSRERPITVAATSATTTVAGAVTSTKRRHSKRARKGRRAGSAAASARTRCRSSDGAAGFAARSSLISDSDMSTHPLLQFSQCAREARRDVRRADPEHAAGLLAVELEQDAQRDHLALGGAQRRDRRFQIGREPLAEGLPDLVRGGDPLLAAPSPVLAPEPVERGRARDLAEPRAGRGAARVETRPQTKRLLERVRGQILGERAVAGQVHEIAVHVVEVLLCGRGERGRPSGLSSQSRDRHRLHTVSTSPDGGTSQPPLRKRSAVRTQSS